MTERAMADGRTLIMMNEPSKEQAVEVVLRLVKKRLEDMAKIKAEEEQNENQQSRTDTDSALSGGVPVGVHSS